jgi:PAS domain S-box
MVSGVFFYTAYQFLFLGLRNKKHLEYLTFGIIVLLQAVCSLFELFGVLSESQQTYLTYRIIYYNVPAGINILFFFFIRFVTGFNNRFLFGVYLSLVLTTVLLNNTSESIHFVNSETQDFLNLSGTHSGKHWTVQTNFWFGLISFVQYIPLVLFTFRACRAVKSNCAENSKIVRYSLVFFMLGSIADLAVDMGLVHYPIGSFSYLILIVFTSTELLKNIEKTSKMEDQVTEGEQRLRQIIDLVPNLIFAKDRDGKFLLANKALADLYEVSPNEIIGRKHEDFFYVPNEIAFFREKDLEVNRNGQPLIIPEETITDKKQNVRILQTIKIPFSYSGQDAILGVSNDITALRKADADVKSNEQLLGAIFENASVAMVLVDRNATIIKINKAGKDIGITLDNNILDGQPGNALGCIVAHRNNQGCGNGKECLECTLRNAIQTTFNSRKSLQKVPYRMIGNSSERDILLSTSYLEIAHSQLAILVLEDVTSLVLSEKALKESEMRYKQITQAITNYIYTIITDGSEIKTTHTPACYFITGYRAEEFEERPALWFEIVDEADRDKVLNYIKNKPENLTLEYRIKCKDGSHRWISSTLVQKKVKGTTVHYDGIIYDITTRKKAETALRESERKLSITFEYSHIGISLMDNCGHIEYMNPAFCRLLDYQPEKIIENNFRYIPDSGGSEQELAMFEQLRMGELNVLDYEKNFIKRNGEEVWLHLQVSCFRDENGEVSNFIAVVEDITVRKKASDALKLSEEKFRNIFNTSNDAIIITDFKGYVLEVNKIFLERSGFTFEKFRNVTLVDLIPFSDKEQARVCFANLANNKPAMLQTSYISQDGSKVHLEIIGHSINYEGNTAALLVSRDITERVVLQQKIMNAIIQAEEKERSFFSQELHDGLGPILSTIKLYLEWIQNPEARSDKAVLISDALTTIEEAIISVKEISNRLSPNVLKNFGLEVAIHSFIKKIESIGKINFEVDIRLPDRLKPEIEAMLYRVFVEAINNSLKYANASHILIHIRNEKNGLSALFRDNGVGFNPRDNKLQNNGNGLFNMQHRVETYEGCFALYSVPGEGTLIEIEIPLHKYVVTDNLL